MLLIKIVKCLLWVEGLMVVVEGDLFHLCG